MTTFVVYLAGRDAPCCDRSCLWCVTPGVSQVWIITGALVIIGMGLRGGIVKTRQMDPSS